MSEANKNLTKIADDLVVLLKEQDFHILRYDASKTSSIYLKLDYGVCNSVRISDHPGKSHLKYKYNVIYDGILNIDEDDGYIRYYYNQAHLTSLVAQAVLNRMEMVQKYGNANYEIFMQKNKEEHKNDKQGFYAYCREV